MKKSASHLILFASLLLLFISVSFSVQAQRPNVILIMGDDYSADELGLYGHPSNQTPTLNRLGAEGVYFETAWSTPVCRSSRAEILTGRYGFRTGWFDNFNILKGDEFKGIARDNLVLGEMMKSAGYATAICGKWQLYGTEQQHGFDEHFMWSIWDGFDGPLQGPGGANPGLPSRYWHPAVVKNGVGVPTGPDDYGPDLFVDFLLDFADRKQAGNFFVYFPMVLCHKGYNTLKDTMDYIEVPELDDMGNRTGNRVPGSLSSNINYTDALIARIESRLETMGLLDNTLIIFTSDNGTAGGDKGTVRQERATRVPMILAGGALKSASGGKTMYLTDFSDILPTLAELSGAEIPDSYEIDGHSLAPMIQNRCFSGRDWIFTNYEDDRMIRDRQWILDGEGRFWDTGNSSDTTLFRDMTLSMDPLVIAARNRLDSILNYLPAGPPVSTVNTPTALFQWEGPVSSGGDWQNPLLWDLAARPTDNDRAKIFNMTPQQGYVFIDSGYAFCSSLLNGRETYGSVRVGGTAKLYVGDYSFPGGDDREGNAFVGFVGGEGHLSQDVGSEIFVGGNLFVGRDGNATGVVEVNGGMLTVVSQISLARDRGTVASLFLRGSNYDITAKNIYEGLGQPSIRFEGDANGLGSFVADHPVIIDGELDIDLTASRKTETEWMLIRKDGTGFVQGTFDSIRIAHPPLQPGNYRIKYRGGDGNDLTLLWEPADGGDGKSSILLKNSIRSDQDWFNLAYWPGRELAEDGDHVRINRRIFDGPGMVVVGSPDKIAFAGSVSLGDIANQTGWIRIADKGKLWINDVDNNGGQADPGCAFAGVSGGMGTITVEEGGQLFVQKNVFLGYAKKSIGVLEVSGKAEILGDLQLSDISKSKGRLVLCGEDARLTVGRLRHGSGQAEILFQCQDGRSPVIVARTSVTLAGSLYVDLSGVENCPEEIVLIINESANPISGRFSNITIDNPSGFSYKLEYAGGDGNDLSLVPAL